MPKLWDETIDAHRRAVRDAALDAAGDLVAEHGLASISMSQIAERTGIARATLYKYFSDVDAIVLAWHERQVAGHLEELSRIVAGVTDPLGRVEAALTGYAHMAGGGHDHRASLAAALHAAPHMTEAETRLRSTITELLASAAGVGGVRSDVAPDELANYCLHSLAAARNLRSRGAVERLVSLTLSGISPR